MIQTTLESCESLNLYLISDPPASKLPPQSSTLEKKESALTILTRDLDDEVALTPWHNAARSNKCRLCWETHPQGCKSNCHGSAPMAFHCLECGGAVWPHTTGAVATHLADRHGGMTIPEYEGRHPRQVAAIEAELKG